jgi:hypothetical protein
METPLHERTHASTSSDDGVGTDRHLAATPMLDLDHPSIRRLVADRGWPHLEANARIGAIHDFVRDEIAFGYNADDDLPASRVLADGYGQCNTKATLLMALLRSSGIPCRFHAATVHQELQAGVVPEVVRRWAPDEILHSWVEVPGNDGWIRLEGVILDDGYLAGVRRHLGQDEGPLLGFAVGTEDLGSPPVVFRGGDTEIQMTGVASDLGVHDDPDSWYANAGTNLSGPRAWLYRFVVRHVMNRRVRSIRAGV